MGVSVPAGGAHEAADGSSGDVLPAGAGVRLRSRFTRVLVAAVTLPAVLFGGLQLAGDYRAERAYVYEQLRVSTRLSATAIDEFMAAHAAAVAILADLAAADRERPDLALLRQRYPALTTALVSNADGVIVAFEPARQLRGKQLRRVDDRDYFVVPAATGQPYVSNAFMGRGAGTDPLVAVSAPMMVGGRFAGVVEGSIRIESFTAIRSAVLRSRGQEMLIVDRGGRVIHASPGLPYRFLEPLRGRPFLDRPELDDGVSAVQLYPGVLADGGDAWGVVTQLRSGWRLVLFAPVHPLTAYLQQQALSMLGLLLVAVVGALAVAAWQLRRIGRATSAVLQALSTMASGGRATRLRPESVPKELQPVADAISRLVERLDDANGELRGALDQQRALADSLWQAVEVREQEVAERTAELQVANAELERLSRTDPLTGVSNVRGFRAFTDALTGSDGALAAPLAVIAFDVDHFKAYNDRYGHPAGDRVLRRIAGAAQAVLRDGGDRLVRIGGEEFVALLPGAAMAVAMEVAERMRAAILELGIPHEATAAGCVSISLGVVAAEAGELLEPVLQAADEALYRAKSAGRNRASA